ncbi:P-loop containing nucleoside triphosphate hydrolase protein [Endogone sp. FLAS-F59071]|nr:P-loop containing nucleoside triphosphate hydrolase protein [Endogone sp. FLAS-F59071]|eukprot:RUS14985.1 P-loop containing nucleoside triphosphate hydrolase protein [Endogone sp. FLAS-F59071]
MLLKSSIPFRFSRSPVPQRPFVTLGNPPVQMQRIRVGPALRFRALLSSSINTKSGSNSLASVSITPTSWWARWLFDYLKKYPATIIGSTISAILLALIPADLVYAKWCNWQTESALFKTIENGTCPKKDIKDAELIPRPTIMVQLERIFNPPPDYSAYRTIVGEHGTGKTTIIKDAATKVGKGVVYINIPDDLSNLENFGDAFAKAIGWSFKEHISYSAVLGQRILGISLDSGKSEMSKLQRAQDAFRRGAEKYQAKHGKPAVLILDDISKLGKEYPKTLHILQDDAKTHADKRDYVVVFVSSEGSIPRSMMLRSAWSRAKTPIVIGDVTEKEALNYLAKVGIKKEDAQLLYELVGGRMRYLKDFSDEILEGQKFEDVHQMALTKVEESFEEAKMARSSGRNFEIGKPVILELLKEGTITYARFRKLVPDDEIANELLQLNVFSYNPAKKTVTFQSRLAENYVKANLQTYIEKEKWYRFFFTEVQ